MGKSLFAGVPNRALKVRLYPTEAQKKFLDATMFHCRSFHNMKVAHFRAFAEEHFPKFDDGVVNYKISDKWKRKIIIDNHYKSPAYTEYIAQHPEVADLGVAIALSMVDHNFDPVTNLHFFDASRKSSFNVRQKGNVILWKAGRIILGGSSKRAKLGIPPCIKFRKRTRPKWFHRWYSCLPDDQKEKSDLGSCKSIRSITVSKDTNGWYYASILIALPMPEPEPDLDRSRVFAMDFSPTKCFVGFDGSQFIYASDAYGYNDLIAKNAAKVRRLRRRFSRKKAETDARGRIKKDPETRKRLVSKRWYKAKKAVSSFDARIRRQREDWINKTVLTLVKKYSIIVVEGLSVKELINKLHGKSKRGKEVRRKLRACLSKKYASASWGTFLMKLQLKAKEYGCTIVVCDKFYPSSKLCSHCGAKNNKLNVTDREWTCWNCGTHHDRDENAARNLYYQGLKILDGLEPAENELPPDDELPFDDSDAGLIHEDNNIPF